MLAGGGIQAHDARRSRGRTAEEYHPTRHKVGPHEGDARVRCLHGLEVPARRVEYGEVRAVLLGVAADDSPGGEEGVGGQPELPLRGAELRLLLAEQLDVPLPQAVQVPPARTVRDETERAVGGPFRLEDGF